MKDKSLITSAALGCAIVLGLATTVTASIYDVSFTATDGSTVTAFGSVNVTGGVAASGTLNVSGPGWLTFPGTYSLNTSYSETAAQGGFSGPGYTSPNGYGTFDNAFSSASPNIDAAGLLFTIEAPNQPIFGGTGTLTEEVFLTYDGGGQYGLWDDFNGPYAALNGSATPYDADQSPDTNPNAQPYEFTGSLTAGAVPEPKTIISALLMLLPFGASALRILRKRQVA